MSEDLHLSAPDAPSVREVQRALDAIGDGGSLTLASGTYRLDSPLYLPDNATLRGHGRATRLIVDHDGPGIIAEARRGVIVRDLSIESETLADRGSDGAEAGIVFDACGDSQIVDVSATGFRRYGVWVRNNSFLCDMDDDPGEMVNLAGKLSS